MIPMLMRLKIHDGEHRLNLFIPLIIAYLLLMIVIIPAAAVLAVLSIFPRDRFDSRTYLRLLLSIPEILTAARNTEVIVQSEESEIFLRIY